MLLSNAMLDASEHEVEWRETIVYVGFGNHLLKIKALKPVSAQFAAFSMNFRGENWWNDEHIEELSRHYAGYKIEEETEPAYSRVELPTPARIRDLMKKQPPIDPDDSVMSVGDLSRRGVSHFIERVPMAQNKGDIYYFLDSRRTADTLEVKGTKGNRVSVNLGGCEARNGKVPVHYDDGDQKGFGFVDTRTGVLEPIIVGASPIHDDLVSWIDDSTIFIGDENRSGYRGTVIDLKSKQCVASFLVSANDFILHRSSVWYRSGDDLIRIYPIPSRQHSDALEVSIVVPDGKETLDLKYADPVSVRLKNMTDHDLEIGPYAISIWHEAVTGFDENGKIEDSLYHKVESADRAVSGGNRPSFKLKPGESVVIDHITRIDPPHWDYSPFLLKLVLTFPPDNKGLKGIFASPPVKTTIE